LWTPLARKKATFEEHGTSSLRGSPPSAWGEKAKYRKRKRGGSKKGKQNSIARNSYCWAGAFHFAQREVIGKT